MEGSGNGADETADELAEDEEEGTVPVTPTVEQEVEEVPLPLLWLELLLLGKGQVRADLRMLIEVNNGTLFEDGGGSSTDPELDPSFNAADVPFMADDPLILVPLEFLLDPLPF